MTGLEALEWIDKFIDDIFPEDKNIDILFKYGTRKEVIEKELEALDIIRKHIEFRERPELGGVCEIIIDKRVVYAVQRTYRNNYPNKLTEHPLYINGVMLPYSKTPTEGTIEFDLLKEVLENETK